MPTIKDVARKAGVSPATVSIVLNKRRHVSAAVRERVLAAVAELGYRPDPVARGLRTRRTGSIGLVLSDIRNPFFGDIARGVEDRAREAGYTVILTNTDADPDTELRQVSDLVSRRIDGLILTSIRTTSRLDFYRGLAIPIVLVNRRAESLRCDFVGIDNVAAARDATLHLIQHGRRRIARIRGTAGSTASEERLVGYRLALQEAGLPFVESLVVSGDLGYQSGYEAGLELGRRRPMPDAVLAANDVMAIGAMEALRSLGVVVGEEVALMGVDDIWVRSLPVVSLSTVRQPRYQMAVKGVELLLARIVHRHRSPVTLILEHELVLRASCGCGRSSAVATQSSVSGEQTDGLAALSGY